MEKRRRWCWNTPAEVPFTVMTVNQTVLIEGSNEMNGGRDGGWHIRTCAALTSSLPMEGKQAIIEYMAYRARSIYQSIMISMTGTRNEKMRFTVEPFGLNATLSNKAVSQGK